MRDLECQIMLFHCFIKDLIKLLIHEILDLSPFYDDILTTEPKNLLDQ